MTSSIAKLPEFQAVRMRLAGASLDVLRANKPFPCSPHLLVSSGMRTWRDEKWGKKECSARLKRRAAGREKSPKRK